MELRQLRYFLAVAEELHFGRAASKLHIAQQSLSAQIKQLEDELGAFLFERTTRSVKLTLAGEAFLKEAHLAFQHLEAGIEKAQRAGRGEIGHLVVGYHSSTLYNIMPLTVRLFRENHPEVEVMLKEMMPHEIEQGILSGQIDTAFSGFLLTPFPHIAYEVVYRDPLAIVLPRSHPFANYESIHLAELANESFIMYSRAQKPEAFDHLIALCQNAGFSPYIVQEATSEAAVISLVAAGTGIAIATMSLQHIRSDDVVYLPLDDPALEINFVITWHPENTSPLVRAFIQTAKEVRESNHQN